jgi:hypothetical protein
MIFSLSVWQISPEKVTDRAVSSRLLFDAQKSQS